MPDPKGFLTTPRELPTRRPVDVRIRDWHEVYEPFGADHLGAGDPVHGLRHPVLPPGLPAGQPDPGVERPGVHATTGVRPPRRCTPPTTSRSSPAGCARPRARPPACSGINDGPGHHQAGRGRDHRPRLVEPGLVAPLPPDTAHRQAGRGGRLRPGRAGRRPAARPGRSRGHRVRARRRDRRPAALRHPGLQAGEAPHRPAAGAAGGRGRHVPHRRATSASTSPSRSSATARRGAARLRRARPRDTAPAPGRRPRRRPPGDGAPGRREPGGRRARSDAAADRRGRQARGHHRRRRHRGRLPRRRTGRARPACTQLEILPEPPAGGHATSHPWPTWPWILRGYPAHEEGGERVFAVARRSSARTDAGKLRAVRVVDVEMVDGRLRRRSPGTERELPADLVLLAIGFDGTEQGPLLSQLGVARDERGNIRRGPALGRPTSRACSSPVTPDAASR